MRGNRSLAVPNWYLHYSLSNLNRCSTILDVIDTCVTNGTKSNSASGKCRSDESLGFSMEKNGRRLAGKIGGKERVTMTNNIKILKKLQNNLLLKAK